MLYDTNQLREYMRKYPVKEFNYEMMISAPGIYLPYKDSNGTLFPEGLGVLLVTTNSIGIHSHVFLNRNGLNIQTPDEDWSLKGRTFRRIEGCGIHFSLELKT